MIDLPCAHADPALASLLDRYAVDRRARWPETSGPLDRIRRAIADALESGEPSAASIAARLKMSVRTLNRTLSDHGTTYRALLDALRQQLALGHLGRDELSIGEIAFLLGFSELSSFHRAFKRWTGETPAQARARLKQIRRKP